MGLGRCTGWPFHDLDPRSRLWLWLPKICLSAQKSENHSSDHYKTWQLYCPSYGYYLIRFWRSSVGNCYFGKFCMCFFFKVKQYFGHISGMVGPIDVKLKGSALVGCWVQYLTLTFNLTHDLDLGCFKVQFRNSSISGIVGLIDVKWKVSDTGPIVWPCPLTTPMTLTLEFQGQSLK